jgi:valyl-tRNA synthetase
MAELSKHYMPGEVESRWYGHWLEKGYFQSVPDEREPYTIVIPPPNVTGVLHMGHCLNNTIQDVLIRSARAAGKNACWVPGTDHASIATEAKVVAMLREKGIQKSSLTREAFLQHAWEWKEKYGGIILQQLRKLGCSPDWERTSFTMDDDYYRSVVSIFVRLYRDGLIYRGKRMVNWDPVGLTALSDEEVIFREADLQLYYVRYKLTDGDEHITVATTRPETILGDVAICVNPSDQRYVHLVGKQVIVPIINRKIPVIADEYVTADFGTGALKVTPAHDKQDNMLGLKYGLKSIDTLDAFGRFSAEELHAEGPLPERVKEYAGMDRFDLRKRIADDLDALGLLQKKEHYPTQVGTSERTGAVIENRLSLQWFVNMEAFMQKFPDVLDRVKDDTISFHPAKLKNTYTHWLENIKDWCISRQLWWGQRIPAWYDEQGNVFVAATEQEAQQLAGSGVKIMQDEDVLDTWFSSWLWPMEVFKGISNPGNNHFGYYYPTSTLVTGQDIIFFWVARMIMAAYAFTGKPPFRDVYFTGMVRDKQGRKMSKQLGNSPDLLALIDKFGADAVRFGILVASPAGNDLMFDEAALEQGRNFNNKLWNALKLLKMWEARVAAGKTDEVAQDEFAVSWFTQRLAEVRGEVARLMGQYRLSEALKTIYSLIWDDFCSWYLEWVKPASPDHPVDTHVFARTQDFFEELLQLLHPFMPFITEEVFQQIRPQQIDLCVSRMPPPVDADGIFLRRGEKLKQVISAVRDARNRNQMKPKDPVTLHVQTADEATYRLFEGVLSRQVNAGLIAFVKSPVEDSVVVVVENDTFYITSEKKIDTAALRTELEKDLLYQQKFLESVLRKLENEKFVQQARPEVIALERKKKEDAEARIRTIRDGLASLN